MTLCLCVSSRTLLINQLFTRVCSELEADDSGVAGGGGGGGGGGLVTVCLYVSLSTWVHCINATDVASFRWR